MKNWRLPLWVVAALLVLSVFLLDADSVSMTSSSFTKDGDGWFGLRQALSQGAADPQIARRPWHEMWLGPTLPEDRPASSLIEGQDSAGPRQDPTRAVWLISFPWQRGLGKLELPGTADFFRAGGLMIVGYSGDRVRGTGSEEQVLDYLGITDWVELRSRAPLAPAEWWQYRRARHQLRPVDGDDDGLSRASVLELAALRGAPAAPAGAEVLYSLDVDSEPEPVPVIFSFRRDRGQVLMLPVSLWSNAELLQGQNLDFLTRLIESRPGDTWWIDEYHHGWGAPAQGGESIGAAGWITFVVHLLVIYGLGVWALARRFGPSWSEPAVKVGSTALFLDNLGGFHHRLGHHRQAAERLRLRALSLSRGNRTHSGLADNSADRVLPSADQAAAVQDGKSLVEFAAAISQYRRSQRSSHD